MYMQPMVWISTFLTIVTVIVIEMFFNRLVSLDVIGKTPRYGVDEDQYSSELAGLIKNNAGKGPENEMQILNQ